MTRADEKYRRGGRLTRYGDDRDDNAIRTYISNVLLAGKEG